MKLIHATVILVLVCALLVFGIGVVESDQDHVQTLDDYLEAATSNTALRDSLEFVRDSLAACREVPDAPVMRPF